MSGEMVERYLVISLINISSLKMVPSCFSPYGAQKVRLNNGQCNLSQLKNELEL